MPDEKEMLFDIADKYIGKEFMGNINSFGESLNLRGDLEISAIVKNDNIALSFNLRK